MDGRRAVLSLTGFGIPLTSMPWTKQAKACVHGATGCLQLMR